MVYCMHTLNQKKGRMCFVFHPIIQENTAWAFNVQTGCYIGETVTIILHCKDSGAYGFAWLIRCPRQLIVCIYRASSEVEKDLSREPMNPHFGCGVPGQLLFCVIS